MDDDWHTMNNAFDSLTTAQVSAFALETSSIVQFFANLAAIEATMAGSAALQLKETVPALWSIGTNAVATTANIANVIASGVANKGEFDLTDLVNTLGNYVHGLADAVVGTAGTAAASAAGSVLASAKNLYDLVGTIQQAQTDAGASTTAYFEAGNHYSKHLNAYQQAMTKLNSAKLHCPEKFNVTFSPNDGTLILYRPVTVSVTVGKGVAPGSYPLTITAGGALSVGLTVVVTTTTGRATGTTSGSPLKGGPCGAFLVLDGSTMHIAAGGSAAAKVFVSEKSSKCVRETSVPGVFSATG